jgi:hypothetical protein
MKYVFAGAAAGLLVAAAAVAQPVAPVGGAVVPNGGAALPIPSGPAPGTPPTVVDPDPSGRQLPLDTRDDNRLKPAQPSASGSGAIDTTTPDGRAHARAKAKDSRKGASGSGSISTGN